MADILPRYPIYVPSKGRADSCLTAEFLIDDNVPFYLVVEPQEHSVYAEKFGEERILDLPFSNRGITPVRNWIKDHATAAGYFRHWQIDDNIKCIMRRYKGLRIRCNSRIAIAAVEDFIDRYENIGIAGMNYVMFLPDRQKMPPFHLNCRVYSCSLILNNLPIRWRGSYGNEDTDYCLQVLSRGWCTILVNVFLVQKLRTMVMKGGNTTAIYQGDGRLKMARSLERLWPRIVVTKRRFKRPQHVVKYAWQKFDTPLKLKPGIDLSKLAPNEYGLKLVQVAPEIKSDELRRLMDEQL